MQNKLRGENFSHLIMGSASKSFWMQRKLSYRHKYSPEIFLDAEQTVERKLLTIHHGATPKSRDHNDLKSPKTGPKSFRTPRQTQRRKLLKFHHGVGLEIIPDGEKSRGSIYLSYRHKRSPEIVLTFRHGVRLRIKERPGSIFLRKFHHGHYGPVAMFLS